MSAYYDEMIVEDTGCSPADAVMIEYIVREEIFHSTLDWQTRTQFRHAARKAAKMLEADRATYEEYFRVTREAYQRLRAENEMREKAITHEV